MVIGVLSIMFVLGLMFHAQARATSILSRDHLNKTRVRMHARSGVEQALVALLGTPLSMQGSVHRWTKSFSDQYNPSGTLVDVSAGDASGRININDGIAAGRLELGDLYQSGALNPFVESLGGGGSGGEQEEINPDGLVSVPDLKLAWFGSLAEESASAWINLRLRRILNAYGEALRLENHNPSTGIFEFRTFASASRNSAIKYEFLSTALGDMIIQRRPQSGYGFVGDVKPVINEWAKNVGLQLPPGVRDAYEFVKEDFVVKSFEDTSFYRLKDESPFGVFENQDLSKTDDKARVTSVSLTSSYPTMTDLFAPHSVAVINLNHASHRVKTAVFYAPANVSLPTFSAGSRGHSNIGPAGDPPVPEYSHTLNMQIGIGPPVFDPSRMTENGQPGMPGKTYVQPHRLMSLHDAWTLAEAYEEYPVLTANTPPLNFDEFRSFLRWHHSDYLPNVLGSELERASNDSGGFNDAFTEGSFQQDYLELILPHIFSGVRRLPRWLGTPQPLLSPLYKPVQPHPVAAGERGWRTAEDLCLRIPHPKLRFISSGEYEVSSLARVEQSPEVSARIECRISLYQTRIWRTQDQFEDLTNRAYGATSTTVFVGPELTSPYGGFVTPDRSFGAVGLRDDAKNPAFEMLGGLSYQLDGEEKDYTTAYNPPSDPLSDPRIQYPFEPKPLSTSGSGVTLQTSLTASHPQVGKSSSLFDPPGIARSISPFGGYLLNSNGHGFDGGPVFKNSIYWSLSGDDNDDLVKAPLRLFGHASNNVMEAGQRLQTGLATLWFQMPTGYPYPKGGGTKRGFQCLFNMTVWTPIMPAAGMNAFIPQPDIITSDVPVMRPVEIKVGLSYVSSDGTYEIIGRFEQAASHGIDTSTRGLGFPERMNHLLYHSPYKGIAGKNGMFSNRPCYTPKWNYQNEFLSCITVPFVGGVRSNWKFNTSWPFLGIPGLKQLGASVKGGVLPNEVKMEQWTCDQSRVLERRILLKNNPENGPGSWHGLAVGWDLNPLKSFSENFWIGLRNKSSEKSYSEVNDVWSRDTLGFSHVPGNMMLSYGTANVFSIGEAFGRTNETSSIFTAQYEPWYPAWRANTCIDNLRIKFLDYDKDPQTALSAWNGRDSFYVKDVMVDRFIADGRDKRWVLNCGQIATLDPDLAEGRIMAFDARVYSPKIQDTANFWSPKINLVVWEGLPGQGIPVRPSGGAAEEGNSVFYLPDDSEEDLGTLNLDVFWNMSQAPRPPQDKNVTMAPWVEEVSVVFLPPGGPSITDWITD